MICLGLMLSCVGAMAQSTFTEGGWTYTYSLNGTNATLTAATGEAATMNIPATFAVDGTTYTVVALAPGFLKENTAVTSVDIPAGVTNLGEAKAVTMAETSWIGTIEGNGNGETSSQQKVTLDDANTVSASEDWTFVGHFTRGENSYNKWGSAIASSAENAFTDAPDGAFRFYLHASTNEYHPDASLLVAVDQQTFDTGYPGEAFDVIMSYDATGNTVDFVLVREDGSMYSKSLTDVTLDNITTLSSALGKGMTSEFYFEKPVKEASYVGDIEGQLTPWVDANTPAPTATVYPLGLTLSKDTEWKFQAHVEVHDGASANQWGSGLLASGDNALGDSYLNGFQFYLEKAGNLVLKLFTEGSDKKTFANVGSSFDIEMVNVDGTVTVTVTDAEGNQIGTHTATNTGDWSISQVSAAIPQGINIAYTITPEVSRLFEGCTALQAITVDAANTAYAAADGVLYDKKMRNLLRAPEALGVETFAVPASVKRLMEFSFSNVAGLHGVDVTKATTLYDVPLASTEGLTATHLQVTSHQCAIYDAAWHQDLLVTYDETSTTAPAALTNMEHDVLVKRTINAGNWSTLCLPFSLTAEQTSALFSYVTELTAATQKEGNDYKTLTFESVDAIEAGKPYLVKVASDVTELNVPNVVFGETAATVQPVAVNGVTMTGNWDARTLANNEYFISNNTFYYATAEATANLKGFRAYLELTGGETQVRQMLISVDGETTDLECIDGAVADRKMVSVYNLSGVQLRSGVPAAEALNGLPAGIYVVDGKKVVK